MANIVVKEGGGNYGHGPVSLLRLYQKRKLVYICAFHASIVIKD